MIGIGLGLITARQVVVGSESFGGSNLTFTVSWVGIATILVVPLIASLRAAMGPANRAARIRPAEALRMAD
jgi:putative ABC transport system permease protein